MSRQQIHRSALPCGQTRENPRERVLRHAFVNAPAALGCRPEPRAAFDNASRRDGPSRPWSSFAEPLRATVAAAVREGGPCIEATETNVTHAVLALLEYVLEPLGPATASDIEYLTLVREEAEALEAQSLARALPTSAHLAAAARETEESVAAGRLYCATLAQHAPRRLEVCR